MMNAAPTPILLAALVAVAPITAARAGESAPTPELLSGIWEGFVVEGTGENPDRGPVKLKITIDEREMHGLQFKGETVVDHGKGTFTLAGDAQPVVLDAVQTNERGRQRQYLGICSLEGDTLKWCVSPQKTRPKEFRSGDGAFLLVLKRAPEP